MLRCKNEENIRKNEDFLRFNGQFCWIKKLPDKIIRKNEDFSHFFEIFPVFAVLTLLPGVTLFQTTSYFLLYVIYERTDKMGNIINS